MSTSPADQQCASRACFSAPYLLALAALLCGFLSLFSGGVYGQSLSGSVRVTPMTAAANQPRNITFSGVGLNGCTPVAGPLRAEPAADPKVIRIELLYPPTLGPCTQALTPYELTFAFTPPRNGNLPILAYYQNQLVSVGSLIVGEAQSSGSLNLSGMWLDWTRPASMVHLSHSETGGGITGIVGTYNKDGKPTWWLIQSSTRAGENTYQARVSEYVAEERGSCTPPRAFGLCDGLSIKSERDIGVLEITVQSRDAIQLTLRPECLFLCNPGFDPAYWAVLSRFVF